MRRRPMALCEVLRAGGLALALAGGGCTASPPPLVSDFVAPAPHHLLPPDEMMSCTAIARSFRYAAARVVRLELGLADGISGTYRTGHFQADAPEKIKREEERLDALADLERDQGCPVVEPRGAVAAERLRLLPPPVYGVPLWGRPMPAAPMSR